MDSKRETKSSFGLIKMHQQRYFRPNLVQLKLEWHLLSSLKKKMAMLSMKLLKTQVPMASLFLLRLQSAKKKLEQKYCLNWFQNLHQKDLANNWICQIFQILSELFRRATLQSMAQSSSKTPCLMFLHPYLLLGYLKTSLMTLFLKFSPMVNQNTLSLTKRYATMLRTYGMITSHLLNLIILFSWLVTWRQLLVLQVS